MLYTVLIQYDPIDQIYIASIPELPNCMAHGHTQEEALKEIAVVRQMWMEEAAEVGRPIPSPSLYAVP